MKFVQFLQKIFRNGLGYNAKDDLELEVCLANPNMIATPKCKIPLDICLDNPEWLPLVGCSGEGLPLQVCLDFPKLLTSPACEGHFCRIYQCIFFLLPFPFSFHSCHKLPKKDSKKSNIFRDLLKKCCAAHYTTFGAFPLDACLAYPTLLTKPACQGSSSY